MTTCRVAGPGNIGLEALLSVSSVVTDLPPGVRAGRKSRLPFGSLGEREMTDDPNEAYEVVPIEPGPHGPPRGWWTVKRNGLPVRHFPGKEKAQQFATDPEYRASLAAGKAWERR
jgi:hypothetical protein